MKRIHAFVPAILLALGVAANFMVDGQRGRPLREALGAAVPLEIEGFAGHDTTLTAAEEHTVGMSSYILRTYREPGAPLAAFGLYVAYFDRQTRGHTAHSPQNCLPGSGWQALSNQMVDVPGAGEHARVNAYLVQNGRRQALVLYWYQGRGRIEANEYRVKWQLLRDAVLHGRSDEALVRVVVPLTENQAQASDVALRISSRLVPAVRAALPS